MVAAIDQGETSMTTTTTITTGARALAMTIAALITGAAIHTTAHARGGVKEPTGPNPLPTSAPAPDVLVRESFGSGDQMVRPNGGKGTLKPTYTHTSIQGFWVEWPGSKDTAWLAPSEGQTWRLCGSTPNPHEMPSPLQVVNGNGCLASEWFDPITSHPTALMPLRAPATPYEVSINGYAAPIPEAYIALGFTDASVTDSNLETSGSVWLRLTQNAFYEMTYELRTNGMAGPVLASGTMFFDPWSRLVLRHDPATGMVSASINERPLGQYAVGLQAPRFVGIEGVGIVDNFIVRKAP